MAIENRSQKEIRASYKGKSFNEVFPGNITPAQQRARVEQLLADTQTQIDAQDGWVTLLSKYATAIQLAEVALDTGAKRDAASQRIFQQAGGQFLTLLRFLKKHGMFMHFIELAMNDAIENATLAASLGDPAAKAALEDFANQLGAVVDDEAAKGNTTAQKLKDELGKGSTFMGVRLGRG